MNKKIRTIVIDDNELLTSDLKKHFDLSESIQINRIFNDGNTALDYILTHQDDFDLILMDVLVPGLDGISILENLYDMHVNKNIIILSSYKDQNVINKCISLRVNYYILKPFNIVSLEKRINDIFDKTVTYKSEKESIDLEISQILHNLGIPSHIRGYKYIRDSILILYNNESVSLITKEIYPQIALKYDTTPSRVERAIRHAIEVSCIRGDLNLMEDIFGFSVSFDKSKPTNYEFLSTIADRIKLSESVHS